MSLNRQLFYSRADTIAHPGPHMAGSCRRDARSCHFCSLSLSPFSYSYRAYCFHKFSIISPHNRHLYLYLHNIGLYYFKLDLKYHISQSLCLSRPSRNHINIKSNAPEIHTNNISILNLASTQNQHPHLHFYHNPPLPHLSRYLPIPLLFRPFPLSLQHSPPFPPPHQQPQ